MGDGRNVTFPSRSYSVNDKRRNYALLRVVEDITTLESVREPILQVCADYEDAGRSIASS